MAEEKHRFTGKKDSNGDDIHEGDVLNYGGINWMEVKWSEVKIDGGVVMGFFIPDDCEILVKGQGQKVI